MPRNYSAMGKAGKGAAKRRGGSAYYRALVRARWRKAKRRRRKKA